MYAKPGRPSPRYRSGMDDDVTLEGGDRNGQRVPLSAMTQASVSTFELHDPSGVYRHDQESLADFRGSQRVAVFVPNVEV
jgi:hypothetical protein